MKREKWFDDFDRLLSLKEVPIYYRNSSASNRRIRGQYGSSRKFYGFRTIILYFQLNPDYSIEENMLYQILYHLENYTKPGKSDMRRFLPVFFNDENEKLITPGKMSNNAKSVVSDVKEYMNKFTESNYQYSKEIKELTPPYSIYAKEAFPISKDLCIFFYEKDSLFVDKKIKAEIERMRNNSIWFSFKGDEVVTVSDKIPNSTMKI